MTRSRKVDQRKWIRLRDDVEDDGQIPCRNEPEAWFALDNLRLRDEGVGVTTEEREWARDQYETAKHLCRTHCTARAACLEAAMEMEGDSDTRIRFGIWGGLDPKERADEARARGIKGGSG